MKKKNLENESPTVLSCLPKLLKVSSILFQCVCVLPSSNYTTIISKNTNILHC